MKYRQIFSVALRPVLGSWLPPTGLRDHAIWTHHSRFDSCGRVSSPTPSPLPENTQRSQVSIPPVGLELVIPACERPQTHALDSASIGIGDVQTSTRLELYI